MMIDYSGDVRLKNRLEFKVCKHSMDYGSQTKMIVWLQHYTCVTCDWENRNHHSIKCVENWWIKFCNRYESEPCEEIIK